MKKTIASFFQISPSVKCYLPNFNTSNFITTEEVKYTKLHYFKYAMTLIRQSKSTQKVIPTKSKSTSTETKIVQGYYKDE